MDEFNEKLCKRLVTFGKFFQMVPYMRTLILNGSLATGRTHSDSDIDILTITRCNRLYTCRLFIRIIRKCLRLNTGTNGPGSHAGMFCMKYYITEDNLDLTTCKHPKSGYYAAISYAHGIFISGERHLYDQYLAHFETLSIKKYDQKDIQKYFPLKNYYFFGKIQQVLEFLLNNKLGDQLEKYAKNHQLKVFEKRQIPNINQDVVACNDRELYNYSSQRIIDKSLRAVKISDTQK
jgi:hypothetical protein